MALLIKTAQSNFPQNVSLIRCSFWSILILSKILIIVTLRKFCHQRAEWVFLHHRSPVEQVGKQALGSRCTKRRWALHCSTKFVTHSTNWVATRGPRKKVLPFEIRSRIWQTWHTTLTWYFLSNSRAMIWIMGVGGPGVDPYAVSLIFVFSSEDASALFVWWSSSRHDGVALTLSGRDRFSRDPRVQTTRDWYLNSVMPA